MATVTLQRLLRDADERVRRAAADAINEAASELTQQIKQNMAAQGINNDTGKLYGSVKATKATAKRPAVKVSSEVFKPAPKNPGSRNPDMVGRYKYGVPYGRIIEFSPRINRPFFYTAWYAKRKQIKENVIAAIGDAWSGKT